MDNTQMLSPADALRRFRHTFRLTQTDVAQALGISQQSYCNYEKRAASAPNANTLRKLAQKYNVTADFLLGLSNLPTAIEPRNVSQEHYLKAFLAAFISTDDPLYELKAKLITEIINFQKK